MDGVRASYKIIAILPKTMMIFDIFCCNYVVINTHAHLLTMYPHPAHVRRTYF